MERVLSPHPLSFIKLQTLCIFVIVWGIVVWWLVEFSGYGGMFSGNVWYPVLLWGLVLLLVGVVSWLVAIQLSIFLLYLGVFLGAIGLIVWNRWENDIALFIIVYSVAVAIIGFLIIEVYRRSHKYIITNFRLIFKGGVLVKRERTVRYDKIADIDAQQGILGQIFSFGTIIPVSQSGFGLGSDKTMAGGGVELGSKKARLFGFAAGGKEVQTPIARSYYELHGVYPFKEVKQLVEDIMQSHVPTQYHKEQVEFHKQQVDIQKQMRDLLQQQVRDKPRRKTSAKQVIDEEEEEEEPDEEEEASIEDARPVTKKINMKEEAFPQEQIDIQQQMKELLKKQQMARVTELDDEDGDEEEEQEDDKDQDVA
ncbi:MAG: PH domain-containing protein [Candidatus Thermoplasmatota archaeon]|nr:PH domain-containing protein [Candidatus Thermoplasmatota archaeon]